ncbi:MAG: ER lumen protein-retaining receptor 3 [Vezdaea aestivalis]|nr:MAG: ER lumen protein-retaining receptor 3 [Vezdaea aestivalis]
MPRADRGQTHGHPVLQVIADLIHLLSFFILIWAMHVNKSAEGVSLLTQAFYLIVFAFRYVDILWRPAKDDRYLFIFKLTYIIFTSYILVIMMKVYPRTREREKAWKLAAFCLVGSIVLAPTLVAATHPYHFKALFHFNTPWAFSVILESVCVLPQLLLLRQTTVPTVISSFYLLALGSYRAIYIIDWIVIFANRKPDSKPDWSRIITMVFGIIQTAFYIDFAWVYWSRQRVKLRGGGVVDDDDLRKSWVLRRVLGDRDSSGDAERGAAGESQSGSAQGRWGARGISVSADEDLDDRKAIVAKGDKANKSQNDPHARPGELAGILENDESDDEDGILPEVGNPSVTAGADEWRDAVPRR